MTFRMENLERLTLAEMEDFVRSNRGVKIGLSDGDDYPLVERILRVQGYRRLKRSGKGTVRRFLAKMAGFSRAQITRLIGRWQQSRRVERKLARRPRFPRRYTAEDAQRLAAVDTAHEDLSGPAVRHILQRELEVYGRDAISAELEWTHPDTNQGCVACSRIRPTEQLPVFPGAGRTRFTR